MKQEVKGITLIALVITIIVLLILSGVTIALLTGENGILKQAQNAKGLTEEKSAEEEVLLEWADVQSEGQIKNWLVKQKKDMLEDKLNKKDPNTKVEYDKRAGELNVKYKDYTFKIPVKDRNTNPNIDEGVMEALRVGDYINYTPHVSRKN